MSNALVECHYLIKFIIRTNLEIIEKLMKHNVIKSQGSIICKYHHQIAVIKFFVFKKKLAGQKGCFFFFYDRKIRHWCRDQYGQVLNLFFFLNTGKRWFH